MIFTDLSNRQRKRNAIVEAGICGDVKEILRFNRHVERRSWKKDAV